MEAHAFELEENLLALEPSAVTAKVVPSFDDSMARDDDRDWIDVVGLAHGAHCPRRVDLLSDAPIGAHLAPWNLAECVPHA
jgi:hypothetical protein